jgi:uncharacterized protein DUF5677
MIPSVDPHATAFLERMSNHLDQLVGIGVDILVAESEEYKKGSWLLPSMMMFRHELEILGGISAQVRMCWTDAAYISLRALFESGLYLHYLTESDQQRRGYCYIYCDKQADLTLLSKFDPSSPQGRAFRQELNTDARLGSMPVAAPSDLHERRMAITKLLGSPVYQEIGEEYRRIKARSRRGQLPEWYTLFNERVRSLFLLATALRRNAEYEGFYRPMSRVSHGASVLKGTFSATPQRGLLITEIRSPEHAQSITHLSSSLILDSIQRYLAFWKPKQLPQIQRSLLGVWADRQWLRDAERIVIKRRDGN